MKLHHPGSFGGERPSLLFLWLVTLLLSLALVKSSPLLDPGVLLHGDDDDNKIGISLDYKEDDVENQQVWSYSQILEANHPDDVNKLTDQQLTSLVVKAYQEMRTTKPVPRHWDGYPNAMALLATSDGRLCFASSFRSSRAIFVAEPSSDEDPIKRFAKIRQALTSCQSDTRPDHRISGRCAEPNVMDLYQWATRDEPVDSQEVTGRMVVWGSFPGGQPTNMGPCPDTDNRYGCKTFMKEILPNVRPIRNTEPESDGTELANRFNKNYRFWRFFSCNKPSSRKT